MTGASRETLRRDLGVAGAYATMVGTLVGAGIFRVTSDAWATTGASVILGYLVLSPVILATSVPYAAFAATRLGELPGGEYCHFSQTFGNHRLAFLAVWLKIISYLGAQAFLCTVFADYFIPMVGLSDAADTWRIPIALAVMTFFLFIHLFGVRWFGRAQVFMCGILAVAILILVVPGFFAIRLSNYEPFFRHGSQGFLASLPMLFFAYAGFESVAHTAGEVRDSRKQLPGIFLRGILLTTGIFLSMSVVTFGVMPGAELSKSGAPMTDVAAQYLPLGASWIISVGALAALATSINGSMLVPARLALMLAKDGLAPRWAGYIGKRSRTPCLGLLFAYGIAVMLIVSGRVALALGTAVLALTLLYALHSASLLGLRRRRPDLFLEAVAVFPAWLMRSSAVFSLVSLVVLIFAQAVSDLEIMRTTTWTSRWFEAQLTGTELVLGWSLVGGLVYLWARRSYFSPDGEDFGK